jgi:hypothetical protein
MKVTTDHYVEQGVELNLILSSRTYFKLQFLLQREDAHRKCDMDDDEDDSVDQEPPYQSLASSSGMKRYGTLASLEMLDDSEQVAEDSTDSEDHCEWDSDIDEGDRNKKQGEPCEYCNLSHFGRNSPFTH